MSRWEEDRISRREWDSLTLATRGYRFRYDLHGIGARADEQLEEIVDVGAVLAILCETLSRFEAASHFSHRKDTATVSESRSLAASDQPSLSASITLHFARLADRGHSALT